MSFLQRLKIFCTPFRPSHDSGRDSAEHAYQQILRASRHPSFYDAFRVADSLDGRFDMLCLCASLVINRLSQSPHVEAKIFNQRLVDIFCADMDLTLREMGVGDLGVAKRVRKMAEAFMGRLDAYASVLDNKAAPKKSGPKKLDQKSGSELSEKLAGVISRNIGRRQTINNYDRKLAKFVIEVNAHLYRLDDEILLEASAPLDKILSGQSASL